MLYIGLDLHWMVSVLCILNEGGQEIQMKTIRGRWDILLEELRKIKESFTICYEASYGYGYLYDQLHKMKNCKKVVVAHPGKIRKSKRKNDRMDARKLAELLFFNRVAQVHVPDIDVRAWRGLIVHRSYLVHERGGLKCQMRALLRANGIVSCKGLWTQKGMSWLEDVSFPTDTDALRRDIILSRIKNTTEVILRAQKELDKIARKHPYVKLAMTMPGVGIRTAEALVAHIDDPSRFKRAKKAGAYFGLIPSLDESAGKGRFGHITREGPAHVRKLLTEAAWMAVRRSDDIKKRFLRIAHNDPARKCIAIVAIAHYIVRVITAMLRTGKPWNSALAIQK